jgi:predicted ribosomally synthesized peptide with SipW-like signal peptide
MFRKGLSIGTIVVILIVALAAIGVAYGLWSQTVKISGTVHTGTVDLHLTGPMEIDRGNNFNDGKMGNGVNDNDQYLGKNVGRCEAVLVDDWHMRVTVTNAYPEFNCFVRYDLHNTGTIPLDVYGPDYFFDWDEDGVIQEDEFVGTGGPGVYYTINTDEIHINTFPACTITDGQQVDAGGSGYCDLHISLYQGAREDKVYTFEVRWWGRQWNEYWELPPWR